MYTRYYDGYPAKIQHNDEKQEHNEVTVAQTSDEKNISDTKIASVSPGRFGKLNSEDILLVALLMITITESKDDFILPLILGALLLE